MPTFQNEQQRTGRNIKTHKTAVVLIPPEAVWEPIQEIRRRYDRQVRRWMPHVTLLYPFVPREQFDEVQPALGAACRSIAPFEVRLADFRRFEHRGRSCTLWLAPEPRTALIGLQRRLQVAVPECDEVSRHPQGFTPHLSVGQARDRTAATLLESQLRASWEPVTFMVQQLSMIRRDDPPDDVFRVDRTVGLGR